MNGYLLDTNVVSEIRKRDRANPNVLDWFSALDSDQLFVSVLVVGELRQGIESVRRRDKISARRLDRWLAQLRTHYEERVLPVTEPIAELWGKLSVVGPFPVVDGLMAATAKFHHLTLATRNTKDVRDSGADLFNPFE